MYCSQGHCSYVQLLQFDYCIQLESSHSGPPFQPNDNMSKASDINFSVVMCLCVLYLSHVSEQRIYGAFHFLYNQVSKC